MKHFCVSILFFLTGITIINAQTFTNVISTTGLPVVNGNVKDIFDYNNDGYEDILYYTVDSVGWKLYRNNGNFTFTDVSSSVGLPALPNSSNGNNTGQAFAVDLDNNGYMDLVFVQNNSNLRIFLNNNGTFTEATSSLGIVNPFFPNGVSHLIPTDIDKDGDLDFIFTRCTGSCSNYTDYKVSVLYNNISCNGKMNQIVDKITNNISGTSFGLFTTIDFDNDQDDDILLINDQNTGSYDYQPIKLYRNDNGNFTDVTTGSGLVNASDWLSFATIWDYDNDGWLDILVGTTDNVFNASRVCKVYHNNHNGTFTDVSTTLNLQNGSYYYNNGAVADFDNDGDFDVYWYCNGFGMSGGGQLYQNNNGSFIENAAAWGLNIVMGSDNNGAIYGPNPTWFDVDNDGDLDMFGSTNLNCCGGSSNSNAVFMRNNIDTSVQRFLRIKLVGCTSPKDARGSRVVVKTGSKYLTQYFSATTGATIDNYPFFSRTSKILHYGLGSANIADSVFVYWSSGNVTRMANVSSNQVLTIYENPNCTPSVFSVLGAIITPAGNITICNGSSVQLSADTGTGLTYQWLLNDSNISGASNSTFSVSSIGIYTVVVSNGRCSATSSADTITACCPSPIITNGLVAYYPFCGNANDVSGNGNNGTVYGATLTTDRFGNANAAYSFNGSSNYINVPHSSSLNLIGDMSFSAWIKTSDAKSDANVIQKYANDISGFDFGLGDGATDDYFPRFDIGSATSSQNQYTAVEPYDTITDNNWHHIVGTINGNLQSMYLDGVLQYCTSRPSCSPRQIQYGYGSNSNPLIIGNDNCCTNDRHWDGLIDDIGIWNRSLSASEVQQLYMGCTPPSATISASDNSICQVSSVQLSANTGSGLTYQWQLNGTNISGATNPTYSVTSVGIYTVVVADSNCSATAASDTITACCPSPLITNGLVAYYPFCGNANDASGNGNNGTVNGATLTTDRFGNANSAYFFNGTSDYIQMTDNGFPSGKSPYSLTAWVLVSDSNIDNWQTVLSYGTDDGTNTYNGAQNSFLITNDANAQRIINDNWRDRGDRSFVDTNSFHRGQWYFVAFTKPTGDSLGTWYLNGQSLYDSVEILNNATRNIILDGVATIGLHVNNTGQSVYDYWWWGKLDDIGLYNRVLTSQEINQLYTNSSILNLKTYLEGFYTGSGTMRNTLHLLSLNSDSTTTDSIQVNLWLPTNLSNALPDYSAKKILHSNGTALVVFPDSIVGNSYYIAVKHRNHLETWSSSPVLFAATTSYDFTTAQTQAFSNPFDQPMKNMGSGVFAFFAGDVTQDGIVDLSDFTDVDNDMEHFANGYLSSDCNGSGFTDISDMALIDNNAQLFLFFARPY